MLGDGSEAGRGRGGGALAGVDVGGVHLDELPAYEATGRSVPVPDTLHPATQEAIVQHVDGGSTAEEVIRSAGVSQVASPSQVFTPPNEPPPGYEEVQREVIEDEVARRLSQSKIAP